jgi:alpha-glucosidase (family GH31 glycosyl hydrolase)
MDKQWKRREILKQMAVASTAALLPAGARGAAEIAAGGAGAPTSIAGRECEIQIASVSSSTMRLSILPIEGGRVIAVRGNGSLVRESWGEPMAKWRGDAAGKTVKSGNLTIGTAADGAALTFAISNGKGDVVQRLGVDSASGVVSFLAGDTPLFGLGEGGPQFDRRGSVDRMVSGQGGYKLETHGGRVPIPWLIGTAGWGIYFHQPFGTFDLTGTTAKFLPTSLETALPLDIFVVVDPSPAGIMVEWARLTGYAEMPPLWSFGYMQSHRTLAKDEIVAEAKTFREKKLPCDAMIYLGTGFCPAGWNSENGSFVWNEKVFPEPKKSLEELKAEHFKTVLHVVILSDRLKGHAKDACEVSRFDESEAGCHWDNHRKDFALGVDGWWPDEGDPLDLESRLVRNRMYWEGPQIDRPNERPFALHRNGYAGMQRYGSFLWSGDVFSRWETLKTHIPIAVNTGLTGIPYWGTDIGGFVPTPEFTAELYLRWFQFAAFCSSFRAHGRTWKLRLPWGWNTGDPGPVEVRNYNGAATPDVSELHNAAVEPICRKYLALRYRMLPYLYSAVRECSKTGMPIMRGLWLHYPDDAKAVACEDQYLWGRDVMVAPVVEKGATHRTVYLPHGAWFDFWTAERLEGGREISRAVDLETLPLYVRAGAILPLGPVKQYVEEKVDEPVSISVYPEANGAGFLYEDDGKTFAYRKGEWMGLEMKWDDVGRKLHLRLAEGSKLLGAVASKRKFEIKVGEKTRDVEFAGQPLVVGI